MTWLKHGLIRLSPFILVVLIVEISSFFTWRYFLSDMRSGGVFQVKAIIGDETLNRTQTIVAHPYSLYWNNSEFEDGYGRQFDSHGYRSAEYHYQPNEFRILVLGGSTTNGYPYVKDPTKIWTYRLQELISDSLRRPVHVFNAGLPYGTSAELMVHYLQNGRSLNPHLIIFHEGGNDVAPLLFPDYKTDYTHFRKSTAQVRRPYERFLLKYVHTLRVIYVVWLRASGVYQSQPYGLGQIPRDKAIKMVEGNDSIAFKNNVETIVREAVANGSRILLVGFLQAKEENLARSRPDLVGLEKASIIGVEKHDKIMKELAQRYDQAFLKLDQSKFKDEWFSDNCHLDENGESEKARQIFDAVMKVN